MDERRRYVRLDAGVEVKYSVFSSDAVPLLTTAKEISAGGIRIFTGEKLDIGTKVYLAIKLPGSETPIEGEAEVVWVEEFMIISEPRPSTKFEVGLSFITIDEENINQISKYIFGQLKKV
ncbi:MAG: PilZ domain-containing protein [Candidatus Omnitrophota bacterium]